MSGVYHTEPQTDGKVIFHTNYGDLDVELWSKECPRACRNFVQLALEGYFDKTNFNRVIPGFMVQGGDPTGTGDGGDSIWGKPFRDELNARIRFNHRGQLAMANENKPDTNRAQFFFTLDECRWLDNKHTIFGKVVGNTVFNLLRMGEVEVGEGDRPVEQMELRTVEVLNNPFEDIVPRDLSKLRKDARQEHAQRAAAEKKKAAKKDFKLLSFGDDAERDESTDQRLRKAPVAPATRPKHKPATTTILTGYSSSEEEAESEDEAKAAPTPSDKAEPRARRDCDEVDYDESDAEDDAVANKPRPSLREAVASAATGGKKKRGENDAADFSKRMADTLKERKARVAEREKSDGKRTAARAKEAKAAGGAFAAALAAESRETLEAKALKAKREEADAAHRALKARSTNAAPTRLSAAAKAEDEAREAAEMLTPFEALRRKNMSKGRTTKGREAETLARLESFKSKKTRLAKPASSEDDGAAKKTDASYHGQILDAGDSDDDDDDADWFSGKLKFRKHTDDLFRTTGGDGRSADDYLTLDPRDARNKAQNEALLKPQARTKPKRTRSRSR